MMFEKKVNRAMDWLKDQNTNKQIKEEYVKDEFMEEPMDMKDEISIQDEIEKNDIAAILISAFLMFTPVIIILLGFFVLLSFLFF